MVAGNTSFTNRSKNWSSIRITKQELHHHHHHHRDKVVHGMTLDFERNSERVRDGL